MQWRLSYEIEDEKDHNTKEWDIYWNDLVIAPEMLIKLRPYQKVNHFPGMECLFMKNLLCKYLTRMKKVYPKEYSFFPTTWILPLEWSSFKKQFEGGKTKTYIVKPEGMSQGRGIFLTRNWTDIQADAHCIVQRYIKNPLLIDGLKFDLRIYILVYGCDPYRIYMYKEGLARLATELYSVPKPSNIKNEFIHLTNYAINKDNEDYEYNTDSERADTGHKRSLKFVWSYIEEIGGDAEKVKREIKKCIVKTFCAVQPILGHVYRACQPTDVKNDKCFEILGFDILLDRKMRPWLLEVNHAPSFNADTPFDYKVKAGLLEDTFKLLHMDPNKRLKYNKKKNTISQTKYMKGTAKPTKEERVQRKLHKMQKRDAYEFSNLGDYEVIYPDREEAGAYESYIRTAAELEEAFTGSRKRTPRNPPKKNAEEKLRATPYEPSNKMVRRVPKKVWSCVARTKELPNLAVTCTKNYNYEKPKKEIFINVLKNPLRSKSSEIKAAMQDNTRARTQQYKEVPANECYRLNKSVVVKKKIEVQGHRICNVNTVEKHSSVHKFNIPGQSGLYVAPKMLEFLPFDVMAPMKMPLISKKKWTPYRVYKPSTRQSKGCACSTL
eukprot:TRINITY_DN12208_c0_g1_i24.p1 TRINITY_DN12208_c0_g1~~TRINITY_DN12208_c0_g1_i24.p1  ORF type:complete len:607 (-),score=118.33 TRINITY_DN12208_c0_g1_i24:117-1937(-)